MIKYENDMINSNNNNNTFDLTNELEDLEVKQNRSQRMNYKVVIENKKNMQYNFKTLV
jgi:hypothetical protein